MKDNKSNISAIDKVKALKEAAAIKKQQEEEQKQKSEEQDSLIKETAYQEANNTLIEKKNRQEDLLRQKEKLMFRAREILKTYRTARNEASDDEDVEKFINTKEGFDEVFAGEQAELKELKKSRNSLLEELTALQISIPEKEKEAEELFVETTEGKKLKTEKSEEEKENKRKEIVAKYLENPTYLQSSIGKLKDGVFDYNLVKINEIDKLNDTDKTEVIDILKKELSKGESESIAEFVGNALERRVLFAKIANMKHEDSQHSLSDVDSLRREIVNIEQTKEKAKNAELAVKSLLIKDVDMLDYPTEGMDLMFPEIKKKYYETITEIENLEKELNKDPGGLKFQLSSLKNEGYAENMAQRLYKKSKEKYDQEVKILADKINDIEKKITAKKAEKQKYNDTMYYDKKDIRVALSADRTFDDTLKNYEAKIENKPKTLGEYFHAIKKVFDEASKKEVPQVKREILKEYDEINKKFSESSARVVIENDGDPRGIYSEKGMVISDETKKILLKRIEAINNFISAARYYAKNRDKSSLMSDAKRYGVPERLVGKLVKEMS